MLIEIILKNGELVLINAVALNIKTKKVIAHDMLDVRFEYLLEDVREIYVNDILKWGEEPLSVGESSAVNTIFLNDKYYWGIISNPFKNINTGVVYK